MVLGFVKCLGAGDRATTDIGLTRSVERRGSVRIGLALGVLHGIGRRLMISSPQRTVGRWGRPPALIPRAGFVARAARFASPHGPLCAALPPQSTVAPVAAMRRPI
jgi:hypothetical protein